MAHGNAWLIYLHNLKVKGDLFVHANHIITPEKAPKYICWNKLLALYHQSGNNKKDSIEKIFMINIYKTVLNKRTEVQLLTILKIYS